jgi:hypothetical protein
VGAGRRARLDAGPTLDTDAYWYDNAWRGFLNIRKMKEKTAHYLEDMGVRIPSIETEVPGSLAASARR